MYRNLFIIGVFFLSLSNIAFANDQLPKQQINVISSTSIYQFALTAIDEFASSSRFRSPVVEPAGTGMGFKQFCFRGSNKDTDVIFASRPMRQSEIDLCKRQGISNILAMNIGYDGIVFVANKANPINGLTSKNLFRALGRKVPNKGGAWKTNSYDRWSDIDSALPAIPIEFYAPSPNTSSSDSVSEMVLIDQCIHLCCPDLDYKLRYAQCREFREDRSFIVGNDDPRLVVKKLQTNKESIGILAYNAYIENTDSIKALAVDGVIPTYKNILNGSYNVRRPLWVYIKSDSKVKGLDEFSDFISNKSVIGPGGLLAKKGLIPLT